MKKVEGGQCRINGVQVGEIDINLIRADLPQLVVKFVIVREDDVASGSYTKRDGWSPATRQLFFQLAAALEDDALADLFRGGNVKAVEEDEEKPEKSSEPPQF